MKLSTRVPSDLVDAAARPRPAGLCIGGREFAWGTRTFVMGILNVTPDSFSGDGVYLDVAAAVARGRQLAEDGADIVDVGGESTRPGHEPVTTEEERRRVVPVIEALASQVSVPISVDTSKAAIAREAVRAGAALVNDVSGLMGDAAMAPLVRSLGVPVVVMARGHSRADDPVRRVRADFGESLRRAHEAGIVPGRLLIDPGFGFGKTWQQNLVLLRRLGELLDYGLPLLVGLSRKSTIARVLGPSWQRADAANATLTALAIAGGADMVRVHDVRSMVAVARLADAVVRGVPDAE